MRTSTLTVSLPPRRMNSPSWMTRSSLAWVCGPTVPISSKKMVPWWATSNRPFFEATAEVKAPLTWPKRIDSSKSSGMEPVFTGTKEWSARVLWLWMVWAMSSLPVPLSPLTSTVERVGATCSTRLNTRCITGLLPTMFSTW